MSNDVNNVVSISYCIMSSKVLLLLFKSGAARVGVWVLRWTHRFYLEDQNFNI